jgi:aquaporin Z
MPAFYKWPSGAALPFEWRAAPACNARARAPRRCRVSFGARPWRRIPRTVSVHIKEIGMKLTNKLAAEFVGTFWLVLGGCGSAVLAAAFPQVGIGLLGVSLAFGLTVLTMAFAVGHVSGGHFNPAVSLGLLVGGRFAAKEFVPYVIAQVAGAIVAAAVLYMIASGKAGFDLAASGLASNGYGEHSPGKYSLAAGFITEVVMTFMFLIIILGATDGRAPKGFAPIAIGLALTLIHLISIPVTNTSVNPARSTGPALIVGGWALQQLWLFWIAPLIGAALAGVAYRVIAAEPRGQA